ncbi:MAG: ferrochelatase [Candidatus Nanopelagicales bacterium]
MTRIDAVLLLSFGGPERPEDVMPFLERVTAGRGIPTQRLAKVAEQYLAFGGVSPINEQNRELQAALRDSLAESGLGLPVYWGNRNWNPLLADTLRHMRGDGVQCAAVVVTSGYSSYSGCRQYRENLYDAVHEVQSDGNGPAPQLLKIRRWFDQPAFIEAMVDNTVRAVEQLQGTGVSAPHLVFTTHSIPISQAVASGDPVLGGNMYELQHRFAAEQIAAGVSERLGCELPWELVYQSRSGPPTVPWLEPDVGDYLVELKEQAAQGAVMIPIGFASDHMEVMWDLDTQAMQQAREVALPCVRAATVGTDPRFVHALVDLVAERVRQTPADDRVALGPWGPAPDVCPVGCCPNNKGERPALCGADSPAG